MEPPSDDSDVFYEAHFAISRLGHFKLVVGPQGQTIASIMELSGAKLDIRRAALQVAVQGTRAQIAAAFEQLREVLAEVTAVDDARRRVAEGQALWAPMYDKLRAVCKTGARSHVSFRFAKC